MVASLSSIVAANRGKMLRGECCDGCAVGFFCILVTFVVRGSVKSTFMRLNVIVISTDKLREERSVAAAGGCQTDSR